MRSLATLTLLALGIALAAPARPPASERERGDAAARMAIGATDLALPRLIERTRDAAPRLCLGPFLPPPALHVRPADVAAIERAASAPPRRDDIAPRATRARAPPRCA